MLAYQMKKSTVGGIAAGAAVILVIAALLASGILSFPSSFGTTPNGSVSRASTMSPIYSANLSSTVQSAITQGNQGGVGGSGQAAARQREPHST